MEGPEPDSLSTDNACFINGEFVDGGDEALAAVRGGTSAVLHVGIPSL